MTRRYRRLVLALVMVGGARWLWLLPLPVLVAAQRVMSGDHYLSDVGGSLLIAAATFALEQRITDSRRRLLKELP